MKSISAKATFSASAKGLFGSRDTARETFKKVIESRSSASGQFVVDGKTIRTEPRKSK